MSTKTLLISILERDIGKVYLTTKDAIVQAPMIQNNAMFGRLTATYISKNESSWMRSIDEQIQSIADICCPNDDMPIEQALDDASEYVNAIIGGLIEDKLGLPGDLVQIALQTLK